MARAPNFIPPRHISKAMRTWLASVADRYEIAEQHFKILVLAAEAWDRCQAARAILQKQGLTYRDRFGAPRTRPEVAVERDSRTAFLRCLRELALENEAPDDAPLREAPTIHRKKG